MSYVVAGRRLKMLPANCGGTVWPVTTSGCTRKRGSASLQVECPTGRYRTAIVELKLSSPEMSTWMPRATSVGRSSRAVCTWSTWLEHDVVETPQSVGHGLQVLLPFQAPS